MQPLIAPLYGGKSAHDILNAFTETPEKSSYQMRSRVTGTRSTRARISKRGGSTPFTMDSLRIPRRPPSRPRLKLVPACEPSSAAVPDTNVSFHCDPYILDGRYANNAWLQELPRPITRLTWDNAVILSPKSANDLDVEDEDRVEIAVNGQTVKGSVWRLPGSAGWLNRPESGFRTHAFGRAGNGAGFDVYPSAHRPTTRTSHRARSQEAGREVPPRRRAASLRHGRPRTGQAGTARQSIKQDPYFAQKQSETAAQGSHDLTRRPGNTRAMPGAWRSI